MPWNNQGGGPWGQGSGGGSGSGSGGGGSGGGPWTPRPGGGVPPPNVEEMLRRGQDRLRRLFPGGGGSKRNIFIGLAAIVLIWLFTGLYRVDAAEEGVELLFGKWNGVTTEPGLHWFFPYPFGEVEIPNVDTLRRLEMGFQTSEATSRSAATSRDNREESLMLTSDQNIVDLDFVVLWKVQDAAQFIFTVRDPDRTVRAVAESAMREVVGQTALEPLLTSERQEVAQDARVLMQQVLDEYEIGVTLQAVEMQDVRPPAEVAEAFEDVQRAQQDKEQKQNQAEAYRNQVVPQARGEASRMVEGATAYRERVIMEAEGEAARFNSIYDTYRNAREVTRRRLYLETMQAILSQADIVIIDQNAEGAQGVVPYLPLNELRGGTR